MSMPVLEVVLRRASTEGNASSTKLCSCVLSTLAWCATSRLPPFRACTQQAQVKCKPTLPTSTICNAKTQTRSAAVQSLWLESTVRLRASDCYAQSAQRVFPWSVLCYVSDCSIRVILCWSQDQRIALHRNQCKGMAWTTCFLTQGFSLVEKGLCKACSVTHSVQSLDISASSKGSCLAIQQRDGGIVSQLKEGVSKVAGVGSVPGSASASPALCAWQCWLAAAAGARWTAEQQGCCWAADPEQQECHLRMLHW